MIGDCLIKQRNGLGDGGSCVQLALDKKELKMKKAISIVAIAILATYFALLNAAETTDTQRSVVNVKALMHRKLESSQSLLKGLAVEDYKLLGKQAQTLQLLSLDAGWNVVQTKEYARISDEFRDAAKKIGRASKEKNLDAAGLGYFQLTMSCIDCHRHVRAEAKRR